MLNFLYCLDENYNIQAFVSIHSILENISENFNLIILHKDPKTFENNKLYKNIYQNEKINSIQMIKFMKAKVNFPKIENSHISEATYYRLYISEHISEVKNLVYLDPDVVCLTDPVNDLKNELLKLNESKYEVAAFTEQRRDSNNEIQFKNLLIDGDNLFNAGILLIDFEKWNKNELSNKLLKRLSLIEDKIQFWDQDVLNSYFNSKYLELEEKFNYKINNDLGYKKEFTFKIIKKNVKGVIFAHYSGKFKPWTVKGALYSSSFFYKDYYFKLTGNNYHIDNIWKRQAIKDLIKAFKKKEIRNVEKPFNFLYYVIKFLLTAR